MTFFGWDASDFDWARGPMDLAAAKRDGITFFTHKATESTNVQHARFGDAVARARDAGIEFIGAYHVVRSPRNPRDEFNYFRDYVNAKAAWLLTYPGFFVQVDLERWPYDAVPADEGENFADIAEQELRRTVLVYASKGQYGDALAGTSHELWNANYGTNPAMRYRQAYPGDDGAGWTTYSGKMPALWQYGSRLTIGSQATCDANAYRGTLDQFRKLITGDDMPLTDDDATKVALAVWRAGLGGIIGPNELRKTAETWLIEGHDSAAAAANAKPAVAPVALSDADRAAIVADLAAQMPKPPTAGEVALELAKRLGNG